MAEGRPARIVILGVGNSLCADDGVGVHAVRALQAGGAPPGAEVADVGTAMLHALSVVEDATHVLAIDAVHGGDPPGTVYEFDGYAAQAAAPAASVHALGLPSALHWIEPAARPRVFRVLGVEPERVEYGMELSAAVAAAVPRVVAEARRIAADWQSACETADGCDSPP